MQFSNLKPVMILRSSLQNHLSLLHRLVPFPIPDRKLLIFFQNPCLDPVVLLAQVKKGS